ncbi:MAG: hypothetical protein AB8D78_02805 [Akkermansiaceae bacterium]
MNRNFLWPCVFGAIGLAIGFLLPDPWNTGGRDLDDSGISVGESSEKVRRFSGTLSDSRSDRAIFQTKSDRPDADSETEDEIRDVQVPLSFLGELSAAAGVRGIGGSLFTDNGLVERLLKVTDLEKAQLQKNWKETHEAIRAVEVSEMKSEEAQDGTVKIVLPAVPGGRPELGDRFAKQVTELMGEGRGDAFLAMKQIDRIFAPTESERTYQVEAEATGDGKWRFHMTLEDPKGRKVWVSETIPDEISHLTDAAGIQRSLAD